eukprot:1098866-Prymnesium_polylepis.1
MRRCSASDCKLQTLTQPSMPLEANAVPSRHTSIESTARRDTSDWAAALEQKQAHGRRTGQRATSVARSGEAL